MSSGLRSPRWRQRLILAALSVVPCLLSISHAGGAPSSLSPTVLPGFEYVQSSSGKFPPPDEVFHFKATPGAHRIRLSWIIRRGFYLYRSRIHVEPLSGTVIGALTLPRGIIKVDPYFGREHIYRVAVTGKLVVLRGSTSAPGDAALAVTYQGCADAGLCYPPITKTVTIALPRAAAGDGPGAPAHPTTAPQDRASPAGSGTSSQGRFAGLIRSGSLLAMLGAFYLAGLALAFTPCCLPMIPILSGLIAGGHKISSGRSLLLSSAYVLGMAFTYTIAGIAAAAAGEEVQATFQQPWILGVFSALIAAMGLAMLGLFSLQIPAGIQTRLAELSNRRTAGTLGGVAAMGALSALIVTSCVAPALVGALAVISQSGEIMRGGAALFALSIGMGTPLLAVGASAGRLLPSSGPWMDLVKKLFGTLMLAVAVWMLSRLVPARATLALWAVPALAGAWSLCSEARRLRTFRWPTRIAGGLIGAYALALLASAILGGTHPLAPQSLASNPPTLHFAPIRSIADLKGAVRRAAAQHEAVMVDFYADWCTSCKEMDATTFTNPAVRRVLVHTVLLRADVTSDSTTDQTLLKYFGIYGPPTIAFYDRNGRQVRADQVVGYMDAPAFLKRLRTVLAAQPPT